jgi:hypothetical protein
MSIHGLKDREFIVMKEICIFDELEFIEFCSQLYLWKEISTNLTEPEGIATFEQKWNGAKGSLSIQKAKFMKKLNVELMNKTNQWH